MIENIVFCIPLIRKLYTHVHLYTNDAPVLTLAANCRWKVIVFILCGTTRHIKSEALHVHQKPKHN